MLKRSFDVLCSLLGLAGLAPLMVLIACLVKIKMGGPVLFRQIRPGKDEQLFTMIKFRTMRDSYDSHGNELPDSERLTDFGNFLRSSSLDELPELWNVLIGDMSLVGPRPLLVRYSQYFTEVERIRFTVRPGITGWAQINGRNEVEWDKRLEYDVWYVKNKSFLLDLKILYLTAKKVIKSDGVLVNPSVAMLNLDEERAGCKKKIV